MTTTQAPEKTPNAFQRGVNAVIDLLSSFFLRSSTCSSPSASSRAS
ncbi:MAG: hypothetical protein ACLS3Y_02400 [Collinsella sp.]